MATEVRRIDIGFEGGQVLSVRVTDPDHESLRKALGNEKADRWFELRTQDSEVTVDLSRVVYVRLDTDAHSVGF
ncbi:MAG TPA: hypothetical protein VFQ12_05775 [Thermoleophilaceae bacterium]|nr:hypothetical protein [Thermoleophilaceae bacterium]